MFSLGLTGCHNLYPTYPDHYAFQDNVVPEISGDIFTKEYLEPPKESLPPISPIIDNDSFYEQPFGKRGFFGDVDESESHPIPSVGDNDETYYPLEYFGKNSSRDNETKGVYEPFPTDNLIPYDEGYPGDNDGDYFLNDFTY